MPTPDDSMDVCDSEAGETGESLKPTREVAGEAQTGQTPVREVVSSSTGSSNGVSNEDAQPWDGEEKQIEKWVFNPRIEVEAFAPDSRQFAQDIFATAQEHMILEIDDVMAKQFGTFSSILSCKLSEAVTMELTHGWLVGSYAECVMEVVERAKTETYNLGAVVEY